jgi:PAS domain S-box-containing protein
MLSSPADFEAVFAALPGHVLLLLPDAPTFTIAGISDELLAWLGLSRAAVLGQGLAALGAGAAGVGRAGWLAAVRASVGAALGAGAGASPADPPAAGHTRPVPGPDGAVRYLLHTTPAPPVAAAPTASHYHTLLDGLHVGTALYLGPDQIIAYANPLIMTYWGKDARVLGLPLLEALPEVVGQPFPALLAQVYATGQPYVGTQQAATLRVAGELRTAYFTFTYQPLRDAAGQVYGIHNTAIDVTAEVLATQQLTESERRFRALVEQAPVAIMLTRGPDVVPESVNAPMLRLLGMASAAEVLGRPLHEVLPHLVQEEALAIIKSVTATGRPYYGSEVPVQMPAAAGGLEQRYFNLTYTPLLEAGVAQGVIQVAVDVTEQVRARQAAEASQAALLESEERFRSMANAAPTPMWAVNPAAGTRYVNRAFLEFLGLSWEEYQTTSWTAFLHPDDAEEGLDLMRLSIEQRPHHVREYRVRRHDGQYRWLLTQGAPNYHASGVLHGYVGAAIDVTDLKEANERLARTNADLDNFIYTASHDLKAPITNIEGLLTMLERELPPAARVGHVAKALGLMHHSVERFRRTLRELTAVGSLQQDYAEAPTLVSLPAVLDEVCLDLDPQLREARAHVVREVLNCAHIRFSAKNLRSVVYNLLSNALKYRAPGRPAVVELTCHATPLHHVLTVRDNGLGFEPARAEQLFELFKRLHGHVEGSGVGLYLVRRMLENAGGRIEATGEVGVGATFTVYFPR